jgi:hypothetical protein
MRAMLSVTDTVRPDGTVPSCVSTSLAEKSTRKHAQQAPQEVQLNITLLSGGDFSVGMPIFSLLAGSLA